MNTKIPITGTFVKPTIKNYVPRDEFTVELRKIRTKFGEFERELKNKAKEFEDKAQERQVRTTEILALFITLFTFISVNVTIFTKVKDLMTAVVFMGLMTICSLILLSFTLVVINRYSINRITAWGLIVSLVVFSLVIYACYYFSFNPKLNQL